MFTVLLRKASGAGYYAMAGLPYEPVVQLSTPITRLAVMEGRTLAIARLQHEARRQLRDRRRRTPRSAREIEAGHARGRGSASRRDMDPVPGGRADGHRRDRAPSASCAAGSRRWSRWPTRRSATAASRTRASGRCTTSRPCRSRAVELAMTRPDSLDLLLDRYGRQRPAAGARRRLLHARGGRRPRARARRDGRLAAAARARARR